MNDRMSMRYSQHPAIWFGVDPLKDQYLAKQIAEATFLAGTEVEHRLRQTKREEQPLPEKASDGMMWVEKPLLTYRQAVGLDPMTEEQETALRHVEEANDNVMPSTPPELDESAMAVLHRLTG